MLRNIREIIIHPIVFFGAVIIASALTLGLIIWAVNARQPVANEAVPIVAVTKLPAPSPTPLPPPTSTSVPIQEPLGDPSNSKTISVGSFVRISGTGGVGLNLRETPDTKGTIRFVGVESEVFTVTEGPTDANGFTWLYVVGYYDPARSGWAVSDYFVSIQSP